MRRHEIPLPRGQDTEFVSFRIGHNNPWCAALTNVDAAGPEAQESFDLRVLVVGHPIKVESVFIPFVFGYLGEHDAGRLTRGRSKLDSVAVLAHHLPPGHGLPPSRKRHRITAVDNNFLETKSHAPRLGIRLLERQGTVNRKHVSLKDVGSRQLR